MILCKLKVLSYSMIRVSGPYMGFSTTLMVRQCRMAIYPVRSLNQQALATTFIRTAFL